MSITNNDFCLVNETVLSFIGDPLPTSLSLWTLMNSAYQRAWQTKINPRNIGEQSFWGSDKNGRCSRTGGGGRCKRYCNDIIVGHRRAERKRGAAAGQLSESAGVGADFGVTRVYKYVSPSALTHIHTRVARQTAERAGSRVRTYVKSPRAARVALGGPRWRRRRRRGGGAAAAAV